MLQPQVEDTAESNADQHIVSSKVQLISVSEGVNEDKVGGHSLRAENKDAETLSGPLSCSELVSEELKCDTSQKTLTIQLLLPNQRPQRVKLNEKHTVLELYKHVKFLTNATATFQILNQGTQPPTPLSDPEQTAGEANLNRVRVKVEMLG